MQYRPRPVRKMNARQTIGLIVLVCTSVLPALGLSGFLPGFRGLGVNFITWLVISIVGGAIGGTLATTNLRYWYVAGIAGVLIGPGMLIATYYYTSFRSALLSIEILIPMVIGALPGLLFLFLVVALFRKRIQAQKSPYQQLPGQ